MATKLIYPMLLKLLSRIVLRARSDTTKEIEILVLRHQLAVLQRRTPRARISWTDRAVSLRSPGYYRSSPLRIPGHAGHHPALAPPARRPPLDRPTRAGRPTCHSRRCPRPDRAPGHRRSRTWRYRRVHGELVGLGYQTGASTVWKMLQAAGIGACRVPKPDRGA